jgi:hypothetical protein
MAIVNSLFTWYLRKRITQIEYFMNNPHDIQEQWRKKLISEAENTEWGKKYEYKSIRTAADFKNRVPVQSYEGVKPYIERTMKGEQNVLWPSEIKWFAKSSGTTSDKSKFIPVSFETMEDCHFKGGKDMLSLYCNNFPDTNIFDGKGLVIGGSHQVNKFNSEAFYGDLSAVIIQNMPIWAQFLTTPNLSIALMDDWEEKIERMAQATVNENVTNISGVPTWTMVLIQRLFEITGKNNLLDIWPNLELYIHGGVSFVPYRDQFKQLLASSKVHYLETYNASEGFFGIQDRNDSQDLLLMLDYGIYYEFVPLDEVGKEYPDTVSLADVKTDTNYAVVISNNSGLFRYLIGDTIKFTSVNPYRMRVSGRTRHFINAFGEELIIENAEKALARACTLTNSSIREYTAAPVYFSSKAQGSHEWLIEFENPPADLDQFAEILDRELKTLNSDYEAKRHKDIALRMPTLRSMKEGTFYNWLKSKGKLGGQHKVPRLSNDRKFVDEIMEMDNPSAPLRGTVVS